MGWFNHQLVRHSWRNQPLVCWRGLVRVVDLPKLTQHPGMGHHSLPYMVVLSKAATTDTPQLVYYQQKKGRFALNIMILQIYLCPFLGTPKHDHIINCHYLLSNFRATQRFFISFDVVTWFSLSVFQRKNSDKIQTKRCHIFFSTLKLGLLQLSVRLLGGSSQTVGS